MWKVCVVFFGVLWSRIECLKTFSSLRSGRRPFFNCRPPAPTFHSVSDMLFSCDFPLSAAAATGCVPGWVCLGGRLLFCFLDDDFSACDSYVCLPSTFMTIYPGKLYRRRHFHCSGTWSTLCFYWLHENIFHSSSVSSWSAPATLSHNCQPQKLWSIFLCFFFFVSSGRAGEQLHVSINFLIKLLDSTLTLCAVVACEWRANWLSCRHTKRARTKTCPISWHNSGIHVLPLMHSVRHFLAA